MASDYSQYESRADKADADQQEALHLRQRRAINNAYAALQGRQVADTFYAFTFEEAADAYIEEVEGADTEAHPNKLKRVAHIKGALGRAIDELKKVPPETFLDTNYAQAANTPDDWGGEDSVE